MPSFYDRFKSRMTKITDINHAAAVLHWDKETYMPEKGALHRSQQLATLSAIAHNEFTDPNMGKLLGRLSTMKSLNAKQKKNVAVTFKDYKRATKLSEAFVRRKSMAISNAYHAWMKARKAADYSIYMPALQEVIDIIREEVELVGYEEHPYDACLDLYEPGMTVKELDQFFSGVKNDLTPLIQEINKANPVNDKFLRKKYPRDKQWQFGIEVLKNMGYDLSAGRQDISEHPFTINFSPGDVRVTTRIDERDFSNMTWSCIHEGGHALYEQGLPMEEYGLATGSAISLAIHESQSRLWENNVGRSLEYWTYLFPRLKKVFPQQLKKVDVNQFYKAINGISPNLIRTEADELHYHLHVLVRYEIEKAILENKVNADGLKELWNSKYQEYLGLHADNDNQGILQDIHWSHGSFGYFPTYSLGSFYAAQFFAAAQKDIKKLNKKLKKGNTQPLLQWLRDNIHQYGRTYEADELCEKITGEKLNTRYFIDYATEKFNSIYQTNDSNKKSKMKSKKNKKNKKKGKKK